LDTPENTQQAERADALDAVATQHILDRLKQATAIAERDLPGGIEQFHHLLSEATAQAEAWRLARDVTGGAPVQPVGRLESCMLARSDGRPVDEFLLIPFGEVKVERPMSGDSFVFTRAHAESITRWFERIGRKLAIDYEHQSFERYNTRTDGLRPAAGWIGRLDIRDDGLWACSVTWTERARQLLSSGEYRYFSPVVYWTDEDYSDVAALGPVALTNDPAMRGVQPLAATRRPDDDEGTSEGRVDDALSTDTGDTSGPEAVAVLRAEISALNDEVAVLQRQLVTQEADAFVERGLRLGKIVDSTSGDWREDYLRDSEGTAARLERAPVLLPPGRVIQVAARDGGTGGAGASVGPNSSRRGHAGGAVDAEDLAAFDRALAAGRILQFAAPQQT
jgi:phage I-like protein